MRITFHTGPVLVLVCLLSLSAFSQEGTEVTAVSGPSWLNHLHRSFAETSMGKTWSLGPPPTPGQEVPPATLKLSSLSATQTVTLSGSDLYRLNCRGCHGEAGLGVPPEINSVIDPVRATSVALILERMKKSGMDISHADAAQLARQAQAALLQRIRDGGRDMPAFPQLSEAETRSLVGYLKELAGVPGAEHEQVTVRESRMRVGEHIVKSTCHICHGAAGPNPDPQQLGDGAIPPLETLTTRTTEAEFVRKITQGAPIMMGTPPLWCRGRMPVLYYLSADEAAGAYLYLTSYPPYHWAVLDSANASAELQKQSSHSGEKNHRAHLGSVSAAGNPQGVDR
jgi:mono/diheme cytochrome c family protein